MLKFKDNVSFEYIVSNGVDKLASIVITLPIDIKDLLFISGSGYC